MKNQRKRKPEVVSKVSKSRAVAITKAGAGQLQPEQITTLTPGQEAQHITFVLQGMLKRSRLQFLIIGRTLTEFRDSKRYEDLHYKDVESYSEERLGLGRASLYRYVQTYEWVLEKHKEWLQPKPEGFIPDFYDCVDLMWIEHELDNKKLDPETKSALEALEKKALAGKLKKGDLDPYRRKKHEDELKAVLSQLMKIRARSARLAKMPQDALTNLDAAIASVRNVTARLRQQRRKHHL